MTASCCCSAPSLGWFASWRGASMPSALTQLRQEGYHSLWRSGILRNCSASSFNNQSCVYCHEKVRILAEIRKARMASRLCERRPAVPSSWRGQVGWLMGCSCRIFHLQVRCGQKRIDGRIMATDPPGVAPSKPEASVRFSQIPATPEPSFVEPPRHESSLLRGSSRGSRDTQEHHWTNSPSRSVIEPQNESGGRDTTERPAGESSSQPRRSLLDRIGLNRRNTGDSLQIAAPGAKKRAVNATKNWISQGQTPDQSFQLKPSKTHTPLRKPAMYIVSVHDIEEHNHSATIPFGTKDSTSTSHRPLALVRRPKQRSIFSARRRKAGYDDDEMNEVELALKKPVQWLEDPDVVGSIMPETRVLHFSYPEPPEGELDWEAYIVNVATQLVGRLEDWQKTEGRKTPFLFVGHGIGGLVVQEAVILRTKSIDIAPGMEVGYIFLNTPFPTFEDGEPWHNNDYKAAESWGFSRGQRIRRYDFIGRILASKGKFSVLSLWQDFVFATGGRVEEMPIAWLYRSDETNSIPPSPHRVFVGANGSSTSLFHTLRDEDYESILVLTRSLAALHASKHPKLFDLLELAFRAGRFPRHVCDGWGRSLLHLAASHQNLRAVEFLMAQFQQNRLVFQHRDEYGRTPLHHAVMAAAKLHVHGDRHTSQQIIKTLMSSTSRIYRRDKYDWTAWDYVKPGSPNEQWIMALKRVYKYTDEDDFTLPAFIPPKGAQEEVCKTFRSLVAAFHSTRDGHHTRWTSEEHSVHHLLYKAGPHRTLQSSRFVDAVNMRFRWIHFPANNRAWVQDLFIGLGLQDGSMLNQHREGFTSPFNYFFAKAEQYTQAKIIYPDVHSDQWPAAPASASSEPIKQQQCAVALFMPFLGFETKANLDLLDKPIRDIAKGEKVASKNAQIELAKAYIKHGLHPRRPLDQFSYTSRREEQIMPTLGRKADEEANGAAALMVDQLWLWLLDDGTVVTCFPNACDWGQAYNLKVILREAIGKKNRTNTVKSLVELIISSSVDFFARPGPQGATFVSCFQRAINDVAGAETKLFDHFETSAAKLVKDSLSAAERDRLTGEMLEFRKESKLLMHIRDIQDELNIVKTVVEQQKAVIEQLSRAISAFYQNSTYSRQERTRDEMRNAPPGSMGTYYEEMEDEPEAKSDAGKHRDVLQESIITSVEDNLRVVIGMLEYAGRIEHSIDHLLDLKQKQANALEARYAREGSEQSRRQGNIMLYWTTITIIFLPMSFLSSFFTINVSEFPKDDTGGTSWPLRRLSAYLFGVSIALILPLLIFGFFLRFTPSQLWTRVTASNRHTDGRHSGNADGEDGEDEKPPARRKGRTESASQSSDYMYPSYYSNYTSTDEAGPWSWNPLLLIRNVWRRHPSPAEFALYILKQLGFLINIILFGSRIARRRRERKKETRETHYNFSPDMIYDEEGTSRWRVTNYLSQLRPDPVRPDLESEVHDQETPASPTQTNEVHGDSSVAAPNVEANSAQETHAEQGPNSQSWLQNILPRRLLQFKARGPVDPLSNPDADLERGPAPVPIS